MADQRSAIAPRAACPFPVSSMRHTAALVAATILGACGGSTPPAEVAGPESPSYDARASFGTPGAQPSSASPVAEEAAPENAGDGSGYQQSGSPPVSSYPRVSGSYESSPGAGEAHKSDGPAPWRRPGLATQWGEERGSQVREVSFFRQNPSAPAATLRVQYDEEAGILAATGRGEDNAYQAVFPLHGGDLVVRIEDADGDPLPSLHAGGRSYVIGDEGARYQLRIDNNTPGRFEIVASVDGLDVLDGAEANYGKRGYLVSPWSSVTIEGFRDSYETVRAFRFGDVGTSYAAQRGKARNIGVIGIAAFEEQGFYWPRSPDEQWRRGTADPFPGRFAPAP